MPMQYDYRLGFTLSEHLSDLTLLTMQAVGRLLGAYWRGEEEGAHFVDKEVRQHLSVLEQALTDAPAQDQTEAVRRFLIAVATIATVEYNRNVEITHISTLRQNGGVAIKWESFNPIRSLEVDARYGLIELKIIWDKEIEESKFGQWTKLADLPLTEVGQGVEVAV